MCLTKQLKAGKYHIGQHDFVLGNQRNPKMYKNESLKTEEVQKQPVQQTQLREITNCS